MKVIFEKIDPRAEIPKFETSGSAGADLKACLDEGASILVPVRSQHRLIPTGLKIKIPEGYEAQIRPRSGLALKHGITVLNSPGTIDSDYRGPLGVILINHLEDEGFRVKHGDRIAQIVFNKVEQPEFEEGTVAEDTERGSGGFGSTGKS